MCPQHIPDRSGLSLRNNQFSRRQDGSARLFGGDESWRRSRYRACAEIGRDRRRLRSINQAGAAQQRREIVDLAVMVEDLAVKTGQEFRQTHVFLGCDFFQRIPERHLQPDRGAMAVDAERSGLRFIVPLRLVSEQLAHTISSRSFYSFSKRYTPQTPVTMFPSRSGHA